MDSSFGSALAESMATFFIICLIVAAVVGVGLWELFWWLYHHLSISWVWS